MASSSGQNENDCHIQRFFEKENDENEESDPFNTDSDESWHPSSSSSSSDDNLLSINTMHY